MLTDTSNTSDKKETQVMDKISLCIAIATGMHVDICA